MELSSGQNAVALAIDSSSVYWASIDTYVVDQYDTYHYANIRFIPKSGGTTQLLVHTKSNNVRNIVARDDGVLWSAGTCNPCDYPGAERDWALFTSDARSTDGYRVIIGFTIPMSSGAPVVAANAANAFAPSYNYATNRWNLLACDRDSAGNCKRTSTDKTMFPPAYHDGTNIYFIEAPADTINGPDGSLLCVQGDDGSLGGCLQLQGVEGVDGLRVNGTVFAVRAKGAVWTGSFDGSRPLVRIWNAPNGREVDISQGRVYWTQDRTGQYPGCIGSANLDGTDAFCVDQGDHTYAGVRVDDSAVYFIRDGNVVRVAK